MKEEIREIIDYYSGQRNPQEQENIVAMLREIQETEGCISMNVQEEAAEALGVKPSVLSCIIKRYPSLKEATARIYPFSFNFFNTSSIPS